MQINSVTTFSVVYVMIHARVWRKVPVDLRWLGESDKPGYQILWGISLNKHEN